MDMQKLFSLEGRVALVTGGAYGIGFAMAEALASAGAKIAFNCRSQEHLDKALADYAASTWTRRWRTTPPGAWRPRAISPTSRTKIR